MKVISQCWGALADFFLLFESIGSTYPCAIFCFFFFLLHLDMYESYFFWDLWGRIILFELKTLSWIFLHFSCQPNLLHCNESPGPTPTVEHESWPGRFREGPAATHWNATGDHQVPVVNVNFDDTIHDMQDTAGLESDKLGKAKARARPRRKSAKLGQQWRSTMWQQSHIFVYWCMLLHIMCQQSLKLGVCG